MKQSFFSICLAGLLLPLIPCPALAEIDSSTELDLQVSSRPEAKLRVTQSFTFPFLRGSGPLTEGNSLKTALTAELSPLSVNGIARVTWTPIAFFQLAAGGHLGSGWNMPLGNGIGLNTPVNSGETGPRKFEISGDPLGGLYWGLHGGAVFQFDLAAVFPGDWNHLVFRTYHEGRYRAFTGAGSTADTDSWVFESDEGQNRNGFSYSGNYLLGYQMPASPILNTVGLLAEMELYLYGAEGGAAWGDELPRWYFGALFNLTLTKRLSLALLAQVRTRRNYGSSDLENKEHYYYKDLSLDRGDPYRLIFYRAAAILTFKLR